MQHVDVDVHQICISMQQAPKQQTTSSWLARRHHVGMQSAQSTPEPCKWGQMHVDFQREDFPISVKLDEAHVNVLNVA